ncbi:MAG: hypothetical protein JXA15_09330 [Spirochaetales bacterium]|nr:hypothetical protein [Spirochaetales bacterium]
MAAALLAAPLFAESGRETIPAGSWAFEALRAIHLDAGRVPPPVVAPMSVSELRLYLRAIDAATLSPPGLDAFRRLEALAEPSVADEGLSMSLGASAGLELRYRGEESIPWLAPSSERPSLVTIPVEFGIGELARGFIDIELREGWWVSSLPSSALGTRNWTNVPDAAEYFDIHIPRRGGVSVGGASWNFTLARDRLDFGAEELGAVTVSKGLDRVDFALLSAFSSSIGWRTLVAQLESIPVIVDEGTPTEYETSIQRHLYLHRFDWRPIPGVSIGMTEGVMVAQPLELRYLNPLASFHALAAWKYYGDHDSSVGSLLGLDLAWTPFRGARAWGQLALNQFKTPFPSEAGSLQPDAYALLGGVSYAMAKGGGFLGFELEGYYAVPWFATLYGREWSFLGMRHELVAPVGYAWDDEVLTWVGSSYGRDTVVGRFEASWSSPGAWALGLEYRLAARGENALDADDRWDGDWWVENWESEPANAALRTPSGVPVYESTLSLSGAWRFDPWDLKAFVAWRHEANSGHVAGASASGLELSASVVRRVF